MSGRDQPQQVIVGGHGPELVQSDAGDEIAGPERYVCSRCQHDWHRRCDEIDCTCCEGDGG